MPHFRAAALRAVGGWDAWNVTEDADLGLRLARFGYAIDVLASTTFEEAPERFGLWLKQRRRWTKGWMQTLVVLARDLPDVVRDLGAKRALVVALLLTNLVTGPLLTPVFLALVVWHLARDGVPAPHTIGGMLETLLAVMVIAVGGLGTLWQAWLGARRRGLRGWMNLPAMLPYQLVIAAASWLGLYDLLRRPHHWHKTPHGAAARRRVRRPASAASPRA
jgi:glycosyltransferase XagB